MGQFTRILQSLGVTVPIDDEIGIKPENWGRQPLYERVESTLSAIERAAALSQMEALGQEFSALISLAEREDRVKALVISSEINQHIQRRELGVAVTEEEQRQILSLIERTLACSIALKPKILRRVQPKSNLSNGDTEPVGSTDHVDPESLPVISAKDVAVGYPGKAILTGVNLDIHPGEIVVLVGRNGSGKSTLVETLAGELAVLSGTLTYPGLGVEHKYQNAILNEVRLVPQAPFPPDLYVESVLRMYASLRGITPTSAADQVFYSLTQMSLTQYSGTSAQKLSTGYRQRLEIAKAMIKDPRALLLDEPFAQLDAAGKRLYRRVLRELADSPKWKIAIVIAAQSTVDLDGIADRYIVVGDGIVRSLDAILTGETSTFELVIDANVDVDLEAIFGQLADSASLDMSSLPFRLSFSGAVSSSSVLQKLCDNQIEIRYFRDISWSPDRVLGASE